MGKTVSISSRYWVPDKIEVGKGHVSVSILLFLLFIVCYLCYFFLFFSQMLWQSGFKYKRQDGDPAQRKTFEAAAGSRDRQCTCSKFVFVFF